MAPPRAAAAALLIAAAAGADQSCHPCTEKSDLPDAEDVSDHYPIEVTRTFSGVDRTIAAFNVKDFGASKGNKPKVIDALVQIISLRYDMVVMQEVQEIGTTGGCWCEVVKIGTTEGFWCDPGCGYEGCSDDCNGEDHALFKLLDALNKFNTHETYSVYVTPRKGSTNQKEQEAYIYKPAVFVLREVVEFTAAGARSSSDTDTEDETDWTQHFERPPSAVLFRETLQGEEFFVVGVHISPNAAEAELNQLDDAYKVASNLFDSKDALIAGDFNADCGYLSDVKEENLDFNNPTPQDPQEYKWLLPTPAHDKSAADTNVACSLCAYDRFVTTVDFAAKWTDPTVHRFDEGDWPVAKHVCEESGQQGQCVLLDDPKAVTARADSDCDDKPVPQGQVRLSTRTLAKPSPGYWYAKTNNKVYADFYTEGTTTEDVDGEDVTTAYSRCWRVVLFESIGKGEEKCVDVSLMWGVEGSPSITSISLTLEITGNDGWGFQTVKVKSNHLCGKDGEGNSIYHIQDLLNDDCSKHDDGCPKNKGPEGHRCGDHWIDKNGKCKDGEGNSIYRVEKQLETVSCPAGRSAAAMVKSGPPSSSAGSARVGLAAPLLLVAVGAVAGVAAGRAWRRRAAARAEAHSTLDESHEEPQEDEGEGTDALQVVHI